MIRVGNVIAILVFAIVGAQAQSPPAAAAAPAKSVVYAIRNPDAINDFHTNAKIVRAMVDRLVTTVTGKGDVASAWSSLIKPNERVGIKISAAGGELFTSHHAVVAAIVDGLVAAGHPRNSIVVWDRSLGGIKAAGYHPDSEGYQLKGIPPRVGYDAKAALSAPLLGKLVWGDLEYNAELGKTVPLSDTENTSNISHFSKILANDVDKIVNLPVMSNSETNAIAGCIYNVTIPNIDNWRRFAQGSPFGSASLADIYANAIISQKVVLNVMDGLLAQYGGGPQPQPNYAVHHATLYASTDPVALDAVALRRIKKWRGKASLPSIDRLAFYLDAAGQMGLGNFRPERIELKNVGAAPLD